MKALVTGATGFVGGRRADALAERGAEVRCLVRTVVTDRSGAEPFGIVPIALREALRRAVSGERYAATAL